MKACADVESRRAFTAPATKTPDTRATSLCSPRDATNPTSPKHDRALHPEPESADHWVRLSSRPNQRSRAHPLATKRAKRDGGSESIPASSQGGGVVSTRKPVRTSAPLARSRTQRQPSREETRSASRTSNTGTDPCRSASDPPRPTQDNRTIAALATLSPLDQEIIQMLAWDDLPPGEVAEILRLSSNVVRVRAHRARQTPTGATDKRRTHQKQGHAQRRSSGLLIARRQTCRPSRGAGGIGGPGPLRHTCFRTETQPHPDSTPAMRG